MNHTPGPWTLTEDERNTMFVRDANGGLIWNSRRINQRGNARLIAAAPDLLNALNMICDSGVHLARDLEDAMVAALKKADGE